MVTKDKPAKKVYRTCGPGDLEILTRDGWSLTKVIQSDRMIDVQEDVAAYDEAPEGSNSGYRNPGWQHTSIMRKVVVMDTIFLLEKDESTVIAELEDRLKETEAKASAANVEKKKAEMELRDAKASHQFVVDESRRRNEALAKALSDAEELRKTKARMEEDLARIQRAVGELRVRDILGAKT